MAYHVAIFFLNSARDRRFLSLNLPSKLHQQTKDILGKATLIIFEKQLMIPGIN